MLQHTGSFKPRASLTTILNLDAAAMERGVTAISAGNHAIGVAFSANLLGTSAKVVIPKTVSPFRIARCREYGAEIVFVEDTREGFTRVQQIQEEEKRAFIHPFDGPYTVLGDATLGLEWMRQTPDLDAIIIPIGGGGLLAGVALTVKQINPRCEVFGVEPVGSNVMYRSIQTGHTLAMDRIDSIADSLAAPMTAPYSFEICRKYVDDFVLVDDMQIRRAMALMFGSVKLAVEPAGATATAALLGPLAERLRGKRVGVIVCGANIDSQTFCKHLEGIDPITA
jgi:threonine dehydratase